MGSLDAEIEELYRRRQHAFQVMLSSATGSIEVARRRAVMAPATWGIYPCRKPVRLREDVFACP